jgi:hypothetical protein
MWALAAACAALVVAPTTSAGSKPVRSGSVVGGVIDSGPSSSCQLNADCLAWLVAGCPEELSGVEPALTSSIVDVRSLAGRRTRRNLVVSPGTAAGTAAGVVIGGFRIQLWTAGCREVVPSPPVQDARATVYRDYVRSEAWFRIPAGVAWMTAAADDNVHVRWVLY